MPPQTYGYDALGMWVRLSTPDRTHWRYWRGGRVVNELRGANDGSDELEVTWLTAAGSTAAERVAGPGERSTLLASAPGGSVLLEADTDMRAVAYAPHGHRDVTAARATPAFNGEWHDAGSGCYLLGPGHHRPYSPSLGIFLAPDAASPFNAGGLNTLAYCGGDPINRRDPSGHFWKWIGMALAVVATVASLGTLAVVGVTASAVIGATLGVIGLGVEVAAAVVKDETASSVLGFVGLGIGAAGLVAAGPAIVKSVVKLGQRFMKWNGHLATIRSVGASGRGASRAGANWAQQADGVGVVAESGDTLQQASRATRSSFASDTVRELARERGYPLLSELSDLGRTRAQANARTWINRVGAQESRFDFTQERGLTTVQLGPDRVVRPWDPSAAAPPVRAAEAAEIPVNIPPYSRTATTWSDVPPAYRDYHMPRLGTDVAGPGTGLPPPYYRDPPPPYEPNGFGG